MINTDLDTASLAKQYAEDNRLRIPDFLSPEVAERLWTTCREHVPYEYLCHVDGKNLAIPAPALQDLDSNQQKELTDKITAAAANGVGFFYGGYKMRRSMPVPDDEHLPLLHEVFDFLNSSELLSLISRITGVEGLTYADAQYTSYAPGQFLTRHKDDITQERRRVAYTIGLSRNWHTDWGGLLHFFEDDGRPRDFWIPAFNTLSLFDVRHVHSVSYVTPFAKEARLSLTGWFCD